MHFTRPWAVIRRLQYGSLFGVLLLLILVPTYRSFFYVAPTCSDGKMNSGEIRILLGSTEKAGTGLNVQRKVVAMHHLDIPWKPSELEQRDGRGARQGNVLAKESYDNKVKNYIYAVEQSLDNYKFNLLKNKHWLCCEDDRHISRDQSNAYPPPFSWHS